MEQNLETKASKGRRNIKIGLEHILPTTLIVGGATLIYYSVFKNSVPLNLLGLTLVGGGIASGFAIVEYKNYKYYESLIEKRKDKKLKMLSDLYHQSD